jgi:guanine deaminase
VEKVMPEFRRDFEGISARVKRLQPWLDVAHKRMVATEMEFDRVYSPF